MQTKQTLFVAHWPTKQCPNERIGNHVDYGDMSGSDSFWISLRSLQGPGFAPTDDSRHIGLWVWLMLTDDGGLRIEIEPRVQDLYSGTLTQMERLTKRLKAITRRMPEVPRTIAHATLFGAQVLPAVFKALRITKTVQYAPLQAEKFVPASTAVGDIAMEFERRAKRLKAGV